MASWTTQSTDSLLPGEPWTSAKALAAFENPVAIAEGASGAPIIISSWHGYDAVNVGDGNSGLFYTGASQTYVETPNFADGFEYRILGRAITFTPTSVTTLVVDYLIGGAWETIYTSTASSSGPLDFDLWIRSPRRTSRRFLIDYSVAFGSTGSSWGPTNGTQENGVASIADNNETIVTRARFGLTSRTVNGGQAYLLHRKEF